MNFKQSPVIFNEEEHSYHLGEKRLLGITGLIHSILGLGVYPEANEYTKDRIIPRAGSRGTAVHHAIQTYDELGIKDTQQIVHTKYGCKERDNIEYVDETWDVSQELEYYIHHQKGFKPLANELTVSDNVRFASQIDNVWQYDKTGGIWLVDTKTNNIDLYPLCGYFHPSFFTSGEQALKEYLSWQLSIYAELFEAENPEMKVEGLACNWLRKDRAEFWVIDRKPSNLVWSLLETEYVITDNGPVYFHPNSQIFLYGLNLPAIKEKTDIVPTEVVDYVANLLHDYKLLEAKLNEAKGALRAAMQSYEVDKFDFGKFSASISADTETTTFDTTAFKKAHPELYKKFSVKKLRKGAFRLTDKSNQ